MGWGLLLIALAGLLTAAGGQVSSSPVPASPPAVPSNVVQTSPSPVAASPSSVAASPSSVAASPSAVAASPSSVPASPSSVPASPSSIPVSPSSIPASPSKIPASPSSVPASPSSVPASPSSIPASPSSVPASPSPVAPSPSAVAPSPSKAAPSPSRIPASPSRAAASPSRVPLPSSSPSRLPAATMTPVPSSLPADSGLVLNMPLQVSGVTWPQVQGNSGAIQASVQLDVRNVLLKAPSRRRLGEAEAGSPIPYTAIAVDWVASKLASAPLQNAVSLNVSVLCDYSSSDDPSNPDGTSAYANCFQASNALQTAANQQFSFWFSDILAALSSSCNQCAISAKFGTPTIAPNTRTSSKSGGGLSPGIIAAIVVGVILIAVAIFVVRRRRVMAAARAGAAPYSLLQQQQQPGGGQAIATMNPAQGYYPPQQPQPSQQGLVMTAGQSSINGYGQPNTFGAAPTAPMMGHPGQMTAYYPQAGNPNAPKSLSSYDF